MITVATRARAAEFHHRTWRRPLPRISNPPEEHKQVGYIRVSGSVYGMAISQVEDRPFLSTRRSLKPRASTLEIADTRKRAASSTG